MRFEYGALLFAKFQRDSLAVADDLVAGGGDGLIETFEFIFDRIARDEPPGDSKSLVIHHQRFTDNHTW